MFGCVRQLGAGGEARPNVRAAGADQHGVRCASVRSDLFGRFLQRERATLSLVLQQRLLGTVQALSRAVRTGAYALDAGALSLQGAEEPDSRARAQLR